MIQNNNSSEGTQPSKPVSSTQPNKPKRRSVFLFNALGLIVILAIAVFGGYGSGISIRKETKSSAILQQLGEQYQLALVDMQFGRYDNAKQRLEFIIENDPSFPGVQDTLTQVLVQMNTQSTSQPAATVTPSTTPTPDFSGVEEAYTKAQQLIAAQDWPGALSALDQMRKFDPNYQTSQVDGMYYFALRNYGYDLIAKQGNLEGGIYQLTLAERFGQLDNNANGLREGARYYILGASFWEINWEQALFYFNQIYGGWPSLWDGTMTASDRYRIASMRYGDELYGRKQYCDAVDQYENAQAITPLDKVASDNYSKAYVACFPPTAIPVVDTPTVDVGVTEAPTEPPPTEPPPTEAPTEPPAP